MVLSRLIHRSKSAPVDKARHPQCLGVHARIDPPEDLLLLAAQQSWVVTAEQAIAHGLPRASLKRLVDHGVWQRLARGVFLLGVGEPTWLALAWAGTLIGGDRSRLGFAAAGHLWGLVEDPPPTIPVLVPWTTVLDPREPWTFRRERPGVRSDRSPGYPSRTTLEDTVIDLCADATPRELVSIVTGAVQSRRTSTAALLAALDRRTRLSQRGLLKELLADVGEGAESALELRYLHDVERRHRLPRARRQHRSARRRAVRDLRYEEYALLIELDGRVHIAGRFRDMERDNGALLDGEVTLRYGWADVSGRPCQVAGEVARLLTLRGWSGLLTRCSWCSTAQDDDLTGT